MGVAQSAYALPPPGNVGNLATAGLGAGQSVAKPLPFDYNTVTTLSAVGDGVSLPPAVAGVSVVVVNATAGALQVFGLALDTINGIAAATGVGMAAGLGALFVCPKPGLWYRFLQA